MPFNFRFVFMVVWLSLSWSYSAHAQDSFNFVPLPGLDDSAQPLAENVHYLSYPSTSDELDVFGAWGSFKSGEFKQMQNSNLSFLDPSETLWTIIPVEVNEDGQSEYVVWLTGTNPLTIDMWLLDESQNVLEYYETGTLRTYATRPQAERSFGLPIGLDIKGKFYVVFKLTLPDQAQLQFYTGPAVQFLEQGALDAIFWSVYVGLAAMMTFYSLFLFWVTRRREFLIYGFYIVSIVLAALTSSELMHRYVWPDLGVMGFRIVTAFGFLSGAIASLFIAELLELRTKNRVLWRVFCACIATALLLCVLALNIDIHQSLALSIYWGGGLTLFLVSVGLVRAAKGSTIGRLLSCGWAAQLLGLGCLLAHNSGWMHDVILLDFSFLIGSSVEMLFFSLAIPLGLRELIFEKDKILEDIERVSVSHEDGQTSVSRVQEEIDALHSQLLRERRDLSRLTESYERASDNLAQAEQKLAQSEKLASLGQLIVGVSSDLGEKASEVRTTNKELSYALNDWLAQSEKLVGQSPQKQNIYEQTLKDLRRLFVFVEKGAHSILRMNQALEHYSAGESQPLDDVILTDIVEDIRIIIHGRIRQHRLEFSIDETLSLRCRRSQVERVLGNLLTNASDAINDLHEELQSDGGDGVIRVSAVSRYESDREWVLIQIEDSGPGIPPESREKVLQPFMTTKTLHRGTGLGLFTADTIVRDNGGHMEIGDSEALGGAKISLWFPVLGKG